MNRTLILGYGNIDRQDDGAAWHVLVRLAQHWQRPVPTPEDGFHPTGQSPDLVFQLQLTPESADILAQYEKVFFIDTHTGSIPGEINLTEVDCKYQTNPFTHHMTPATCLALTQVIYQNAPRGILVSIRGREFGFSHQLSGNTRQSVEQAAEKIWRIIQTGSSYEVKNDIFKKFNGNPIEVL